MNPHSSLFSFFAKLFDRRTFFSTFYFLLSVFFAAFYFGAVEAKTSEEVAAEIMKSTVRVVTMHEGKHVGHGTGFIISEEGDIATNSHVIDGGSRHFVVYSDGSRVRIREAQIIVVSENADLAILKCPRIQGTSAVTFAAANMAVGQSVYAVGFPGAIDTTKSWSTLEGVVLDENDGDGVIIAEEAKSDFQPAVFPGAVAKLTKMAGVRGIFHSAKISPGNSGGPLIDSEGRVCGINTSFIPAKNAGADYPLAIDSRDLILLAQDHSIFINTSSSPAASDSASSGARTFLVILFLIILSIGGYFRFRTKNDLASDLPNYSSATPHDSLSRLRAAFATAKNTNSANHTTICFRGFDSHGKNYEIVYSLSDLRKSAGRLSIGKKKDVNQLVLHHPSISLQHAIFSMNGGFFYLQDLNSVNGTKINRKTLSPSSAPTVVHQGDTVTFGDIDLKFEIL